MPLTSSIRPKSEQLGEQVEITPMGIACSKNTTATAHQTIPNSTPRKHCIRDVIRNSLDFRQ